MLRSSRPARRLFALAALVLASSASGLAVSTAPAAAAGTSTRYVATSGRDTGRYEDCVDRTKPCKTLQHAVDVARAGDSISMSAGVYPQGAYVSKSLAIIGSASGTTTVRGHDADGIDVLPPGDGSGAGPVVTLRQLDLSGSAPLGQGLTVNHSVVSVTNSTISHNGARGAVVYQDATLTIASSRLEHNGAAGATNSGGTLTVSGSTLSDNVARGPAAPGSEGYGIETYGGHTTISNSTLAGNELAGALVLQGELSGAYSDSAPPTVSIQRSSVSDNGFVGLANGPGGTVTATDSTFAGNHGGGVYALDSVTTVQNSTIARTTKDPAAQEPGGQAGVVVLPAIGPAAVRAGVMKPIFGERSVPLPMSGKGAAGKQAVIAPAVAPGAAGPATRVGLSGTIVAKNSGVPDCVGAVVDEGYNLSSDAANSCGFTGAKHSLSTADPRLGALADNGGATRTLLPGSGSAAVDVIPTGSAGCVGGATDERGVDRPQPTAGRCDIGAVEVATPIVIGRSALPDGTVGQHYRHAFTATGGADATYMWSLAAGSDRPPGLTFSHSGVLSGVPAKAGTFSVTVSVNDPVVKTFALVIDAAPAPNVVHSDPLANSGAEVTQLSITGGSAVGVGLLFLLGAGLVGRRPGRQRAG